MRAIAVRRGSTEPELVEKPRPEPAAGEALVRTLRVGVDGTDHEVIGGSHGGYPESEDHLVLGHEAVGVVEETRGTRFEPDDVVVPTVRRPPNGEANGFFERGEADMATDGEYHERGIVGAHGFMAEYFTSPEEFLVPFPSEYAGLGMFCEPISVSQKALETAARTRSGFSWTPESAVVLGNGSLGLLTLATLTLETGDGVAPDVEFERTYCLGRRQRPDPTVDLIDRIGGTYVDSTETPVDEIPDACEPMDLVFEATGYAPHAVQTVSALAPNGVGALLGIPDPREYEVDVGTLHSEMVMENKALVGSVNSRYGHFEAAVETVRTLPDWLFDDLLTTVAGLEEFERAFEDGDDQIKAVVEFDAR